MKYSRCIMKKLSWFGMTQLVLRSVVRVGEFTKKILLSAVLTRFL